MDSNFSWGCPRFHKCLGRNPFDVMRRLKHVVDLAFAVMLLYVSYWVYELSNFIAYSLAGLSPTISIAGFFPAGIAAVVGQGTLLVKIFQVIIACTVPIAVLLDPPVLRLP